MAETLHQYNKQLVNTDSTATDYDALTVSTTATDRDILQQLVVVNNTVNTQAVTIKLQIDDTGYTTILTMDYSITAGASALLSEFSSLVLEGHATNPDKLTIAFGTAITGSDTIDFVGSSLRKSE